MSAKKGCTQIRTLASIKKSGSHSGDRHVHHFQVASLELERSRRIRENEDALKRIRTNEERLQEIEALLQGHYLALGLASGTDDGEGEAGTYDAPRLEPQSASYRVPDPPAHDRPSGPLKRVVLYGR